MKWLEVIELRSIDIDKENAEIQLKQLIDEFEKRLAKKSIKSYRRVIVDTDFAIHLFHESEMIETNGSEAGLNLVSALRDFGMVNHSVWRESGHH